jgi:hypothetical protein
MFASAKRSSLLQQSVDDAREGSTGNATRRVKMKIVTLISFSGIRFEFYPHSITIFFIMIFRRACAINIERS